MEISDLFVMDLDDLRQIMVTLYQLCYKDSLMSIPFGTDLYNIYFIVI